MNFLHGRQPFLLTMVFAVVCVMSAMALIYTKHESRKLFVELETLTTERDELNIEWGQLQIEQSTWATHGRIDHEPGRKDKTADCQEIHGQIDAGDRVLRDRVRRTDDARGSSAGLQ